MTRHTRILSSMFVAVGFCGMLLGLRPPTPASAVDIVPYNMPYAIPQSPYTVPSALVTSYRGQYTLQGIDRHSRLYDGGIYIRPREGRTLLGMVQFYGWDQAGHATSWFAVLSNFHTLAHGQMAIDLLNQSGGALHDRLTVTRTAAGDLVGTFHLDGKNYAINWHKVAAR